tara:strand:+ start:231 stop:554 length:324 start_codon:yes stop_codon:yes gene_type:complete
MISVQLKLLRPGRKKKYHRGVPTIIRTKIIVTAVIMGNLVQEITNLKTKIEIKDIDLGQNLITKVDLQSGIAKTLKIGTGTNIKLSQKVATVLKRLSKDPKKLINQN